MNTNLLNVVKGIVTQYGEQVLSEPKRVSAFFADLAKDEPKPQKNTFVKCIEHGFVQILKNAAEPDRVLCKQQLAQKLHEEEGLDPALCGETLELLAAVLFGEQQQKKNHCKNCGKELQEGWESCSYCSTTVIYKTGSASSTPIIKSVANNSQSLTVLPVNPTSATDKYGQAIASLLLGLIGLFAWIFFPLSLCYLISIIGLIMGVIGRKSTKKIMAISGLILSILGFFLTITVTIISGALNILF
jgi:hypothetical protein